tara:strand:- start:4493 stop:4780 length:288 start_codon:yes stop_codon:yes gene_type:complete
MSDLSSPEIGLRTKGEWLGETKQCAEQCITLLRESKVKVMLKPHIWIWRGEFTGRLKMESEKDWKTLEASYEKYMLSNAKQTLDFRMLIKSFMTC